MKFAELGNKALSSLLEENDLHKIYNYLYENNIPILYLNGDSNYPIIYEDGEFHLIGFKQPFSSSKKIIKFINEELNDSFVDLTEDLLIEDLVFAKFKYANWQHDPRPNILVLDNDYIYNGKGKIVPGQHDILGYNIDYSKNKKVDQQAINEITSFAHILKKDKKDIYERIKAFYPDSLKYIRHYKPNAITKLKMKNGWKWKKCSVADLKNDEEKEYL